MTTVYAISLTIGVAGLILWITASAASSMVDSWSNRDPDLRYGRWGRGALAFLLGFGMGGLSASFAGLSQFVSLGAALLGGVGLVAVAFILGPIDEDAEAET
ncbi:MAG: hypothetical protein ACR2N2_05915 [Acidimicrobiia bacterium]